MTKPVLGIIGAGKLGMTLAKLGLDSGYKINLSGSGDPQKIELSASVLAPGAEAMYTKKNIEHSDIIILAIPLSKYRNVPADYFNGKIVIDAMNYWWEIDGQNDYYDAQKTSSEAVQEYLAHSTVIKGLNHMGYHDLKNMVGKNRVIAYAGNDSDALKQVAQIIADFGFIPYYLGTLHETEALQPAGALFGVNETMAGILKLLGR